MTDVYRRIRNFEQEELEDELVLMEIESQALVTLNPSGRLVWEALESGATLDDLEALFREAFPDVDTLKRDVQQTLDTLVEARLVTTGNKR